MKTLHWRHTDWSARNFIFSIGQEIIGQLTFAGVFETRARYQDRYANYVFSQKGFWDKDVTVTKDGKAVGEIAFGTFGNQTLTLPTGEKYYLSNSLWEQEVYWKNENGDTIIKYQQATMSSMGKGLISLDDTLTIEKERLLISSGLFARQVKQKRMLYFLLVFFSALGILRQF